MDMAKYWRMCFDYDKCKVMHLKKNYTRQFWLRGIYLHSGQIGHHSMATSKEPYLAFRLTNYLKRCTQVINAANKANSVLGTLRMSFMYRTKETTKTFYTNFVRSHLEFPVSVWNPYRKKDEMILENVPRGATKLSPELRNSDFSARLEAIGLTTLKARRESGDAIQYYKIFGNLKQSKFVLPHKLLFLYYYWYYKIENIGQVEVIEKVESISKAEADVVVDSFFNGNETVCLIHTTRIINESVIQFHALMVNNYV